jgi:hypothetical protein
MLRSRESGFSHAKMPRSSIRELGAPAVSSCTSCAAFQSRLKVAATTTWSVLHGPYQLD